MKLMNFSHKVVTWVQSRWAPFASLPSLLMPSLANRMLEGPSQTGPHSPLCSDPLLLVPRGSSCCLPGIDPKAELVDFLPSLYDLPF